MSLLADAALCCVLVEAVALAGYRLATGRGIALPSVLANLVAGTGLLIALRLSLTGQASAAALGASLALALAGHAADLALRWPRASQRLRSRS